MYTGIRAIIIPKILHLRRHNMQVNGLWQLGTISVLL